MTRRAKVVLAVLLLVTSIGAPLIGTPPPAVAISGAELLHDYENGCGPANSFDFVPDNSALLRVLFGDVTALPELVAWAADQDLADYFGPACDIHDRCYGTYGSNRLACDAALYPDLASACYSAYVKPDFSWKNGFGLGTLWKAPQYAPCLGIASTIITGSVLIFGGDITDAFSDAQRDAEQSATCDGTQQSSYGGIFLPAKAIELGYSGGCLVVDLAYGNGRWAGTSRPISGAQQVHWLDSLDAVQAKWDELFDAGYRLTNLEYGDGKWIAVFTSDTGWDRQRYNNRGDFNDLASDIRANWGEGLAVTELDYGDGRWMAFSSAGTGITNQRWIHEPSNATQLAAAVQGALDSGWLVTNLEWDGDRWVALFAQGPTWLENGLTCNSTYHETRVALDEQAAAGRVLADLEYGNGSWCGIWFRPQVWMPTNPTPSPLPTPTLTPTPTPTTTASPTVQLVAVPDLGGLTRADARAEVRSRDLVLEVAGYRDAGASFAGRVVDQDPMPYGSPVPVGSTVRVWLGATPSFSPSVPAQQTSDKISIRIPGHSHGDTIERGTPIDVCIALEPYSQPEPPYPTWVLAYYYPADGLGTWIDGSSMPTAGLDQCYSHYVTGPGGYEKFALSRTNSAGTTTDTADFWIYVP